MVYIGKPEEYKGFTLRFWRDVYGYYRAEVVKYKDRDTREEQYISESIDTWQKTKQKAFIEAKRTIDKANYEWFSSGLSKAYYLKHKK